jgi:hypothetical protein
MNPSNSRAMSETPYESPTITVVGVVSELTAGPITKKSESSGGFQSLGRSCPPHTDDDTSD